MSLWLTDNELIELTGYRRRARQCDALAKLGLRFRVRPADGFPLVLRDDLPQQPAQAKTRRINWQAVGG